MPILLSLAVDDHTIAVPISLMFACATGLSSFYNHWRRGFSDIRLGSILVSGTLVGAFIGVFFNLQTTKEQFVIFFAIVVFIIGVKMVYDWYRHPSVVEDDDEKKLTKGRIAASTTGEVGAGFLSGAMGIGGGVVNVPILLYGLGRGTRKAIGTSSLIVVPTALFGFIVFIFARSSMPSEFWLIPVLFPIVLIGAFIGSRWGLKRLKTKTITLIFIIAIFIVVAKLLWDILPF